MPSSSTASWTTPKPPPAISTATEFSCAIQDVAPRLAYACILKAQSLMRPGKDTPEYKAVAMAREDLEKKLAVQAAAC